VLCSNHIALENFCFKVCNLQSLLGLLGERDLLRLLTAIELPFTELSTDLRNSWQVDAKGLDDADGHSFAFPD
jgi:hypothetical protein